MEYFADQCNLLICMSIYLSIKKYIYIKLIDKYITKNPTITKIATFVVVVVVVTAINCY